MQQKFKEQNIFCSVLAIFTKVPVACSLFQEFGEFPEFLFQLCEPGELDGGSASCCGSGWAWFLIQIQAQVCPMFLISLLSINNFLFFINSTESSHRVLPSQFLLFLITYWYSIFVIINEPILTHCYQLKSIIYSDFLSFYRGSVLCSRILPGVLYYIQLSCLFRLLLAVTVTQTLFSMTLTFLRSADQV